MYRILFILFAAAITSLTGAIVAPIEYTDISQEISSVIPTVYETATPTILHSQPTATETNAPTPNLIEEKPTTQPTEQIKLDASPTSIPTATPTKKPIKSLTFSQLATSQPNNTCTFEVIDSAGIVTKGTMNTGNAEENILTGNITMRLDDENSFTGNILIDDTSSHMWSGSIGYKKSASASDFGTDFFGNSEDVIDFYCEPNQLTSEEKSLPTDVTFIPLVFPINLGICSMCESISETAIQNQCRSVLQC